MPAVSILMPAYNAARFLAAAVHSVQAQTLDDWELLIVDDGSSDNTSALAAQLAGADARIRLLRQTNQGQGSARNHALTAAQAPWTAFLDSDDIWHPELLANLLWAATAYAPCSGVFGRMIPFEDDRGMQPIGAAELRALGTQRLPTLTGHRGLIRLIRRNIIPLSAAMVSRECLQQMKGFDIRSELRNVEDYHLWLRILADGGLLCGVPDAVLHYRVHGGNSSGRRLDMKRRRAAALRDVAISSPLAAVWRRLKVWELLVAARWRGADVPAAS